MKDAPLRFGAPPGEHSVHSSGARPRMRRVWVGLLGFMWACTHRGDPFPPIVPNPHFDNTDVRVPSRVLERYSSRIGALADLSRTHGDYVVAALGFRSHPNGWIVDVAVVGPDRATAYLLRQCLELDIGSHERLEAPVEAVTEENKAVPMQGGGPRVLHAGGRSVLDWDSCDLRITDRIVYIQPIPLMTTAPNVFIARMRLKASFWDSKSLPGDPHFRTDWISEVCQ